MDDSPQIPSFREIGDWPSPPNHPLRIAYFGAVHDREFVLKFTDADGAGFSFFFDRELGRLCFGSPDEHAADAAFVTTGSTIAADVIFACDFAITSGFDDADRLLEVVNRARHSPS